MTEGGGGVVLGPFSSRKGAGFMEEDRCPPACCAPPLPAHAGHRDLASLPDTVMSLQDAFSSYVDKEPPDRDNIVTPPHRCI